MKELQELGELYCEGIFANTVNNTGRSAFRGAINALHNSIPKGGTEKKGIMARIGNAYNAVERGIEKVIETGKGITGSALDAELAQLKAKIYYIVLRQQPPVGVGFKRVLQQKIYEARNVADLDRIAAEYKAWSTWTSYKNYLTKHSSK